MDRSTINGSRRIGMVLLVAVFAALVRVEAGSRSFEVQHSGIVSPTIELVTDGSADYFHILRADDLKAPIQPTDDVRIPGLSATFRELLLYHAARASIALRRTPHPVPGGAHLPYLRIFSSESSDDGQAYAS